IPILSKVRHCRNITLKLLMLSDKLEAYPGGTLPKDVRHWVKDVPGARRDLKKKIDSLKSEFTHPNRKLAVKIRSYCELPTIHGFSLYKKSAGSSKDIRRVA